LYLHIRAAESTLECPWYKNGFCRHGNKCKHKHMRRKACTNYLMGFCVEGPTCKFGHPTCLYKPPLPDVEDVLTKPHERQAGAPGYEVTATGPADYDTQNRMAAPVTAPAPPRPAAAQPRPAVAEAAGYIPGMGA